MKFKEWLMSEMPMVGMHFLPNKNWPELGKHAELPSDTLTPTPERQGIVPNPTPKKLPMHGFHRDDIGILTSPAGQAKIMKRWNTTGHNFDIYFVRSKEAKQFVEIGEVSPQWAREKLGVEIQPNEETIYVIFTNNTGSDRMPMNYWTIAHRLGHSARNDYAWNQYRELMESEFSNILEEVYGQKIGFERYTPYLRGDQGHTFNSKTVSGANMQQMLLLARAIGTMKSARDGLLDRFGEFQHELFAQYLMTGKITFNPLPRKIGSSAFGRTALYARVPQAELDEMTEHLQNSVVRGLEYQMDEVLSNMGGKIFVM